MNEIEIEVVSQHYIGKLLIKPMFENHSLFSVYIGRELLGRMKPIKKQLEILWYSPEINDHELRDQIGEWIEHSYTLTDESFKNI
jgi:hypothetical protein